jgi:muramidase (phage lysozyme)
MPRTTASEIAQGIAGTNLAAALDTVAFSELGAAILAGSDDGYNVIVGSTPQCIKTFTSYAGHPDVLVNLPKLGISSSAAGRYQTLWKFAVAYEKQLGLPDFGPKSQDRIALQLFKECHAYNLFADGQFDQAIVACASRWASLPGAQYGQHVNALDALRAEFVRRGGQVS